MKKIICALSLLSCSAFARPGTQITTPNGNSVQCNNWGWTVLMRNTVWYDVTCSPLQVKTRAGDVLSVPTTDVCNGGFAVYYYKEGDSEVTFAGCR